MKYYAGVGSRKAPDQILKKMHKLGAYFGKLDWCLRSGAAPGADTAFENGCNSVKGKKDICLPWKGFNGSSEAYHLISDDAYRIAEEIHPVWHKLSSAAKNLHARNVYQVLGADLNTPVSLVICWTPDACEHKKNRSIDTGGTGTAIACATNNGIAVYNLKIPDRFSKVLFDLEVVFGEKPITDEVDLYNLLDIN